jgi:dolichol-phosphate mannosyltransferase
MLGMPVYDASGNYRCYRVALLRRANLNHLLSRGYSFQQEALYRCWLAGARLAETPIVFVERRGGKSKANWREIARSLWALFRLFARAWFRQAGMMPAKERRRGTE